MPPFLSLHRSSTASASALLTAIVDHARARGIDQGALAARAGISAEALSRLKKAGSCRLTTALALARAAGLTTLEFGAARPRRVAASIAARKLSAGRRRAMGADDLVSALASGEPSRAYQAHVIGFFEELPLEIVHDVILDEELDYGRLRALATAVGAEGDTVDWLAEMAGDGVAHAA
jgi:DNA-binding phage protein